MREASSGLRPSSSTPPICHTNWSLFAEICKGFSVRRCSNVRLLWRPDLIYFRGFSNCYCCVRVVFCSPHILSRIFALPIVNLGHFFASIWFEEICWCPETSDLGTIGKKISPPTFFWFSTRYFAPTPIKPVLRRKRTGVALQIFCPIQNSLRSEEVMSIWKNFAENFLVEFGEKKIARKTFFLVRHFFQRKSLRGEIFFISTTFRRKFFKST